MGRYQFRLPDVGEGIAEAEIVAWHVRPGDAVREDQPMVDVMTDKATVELPAPVDGTVVAIHGEVGQMVPVRSVLIELETAGEGGDAPDSVPPTAAPVPTPAPAPSPIPGPVLSLPLAAPATRRRAKELGVELAGLTGTGPHGRIMPADVEAHARGTSPPTMASGGDGITDIPIQGLRRRIAERMEQAQAIPQITYVEEIDVTELEALRAELNATHGDGRPRLTLLPFLIRALVRCLPQSPHLNGHYDARAGQLRQFVAVHVGVATQTPTGLMVPVVRHAEGRDPWALAAEIARLSTAAREGRAHREELGGSTITVTSLGPLGGVTTTPMLNPPEVAIVGPNRIVERPVVAAGAIAIRKMMNLSSSFDHRIVDGHDAAEFVQRIKRQLEHPALLFMD